MIPPPPVVWQEQDGQDIRFRYSEALMGPRQDTTNPERWGLPIPGQFDGTYPTVPGPAGKITESNPGGNW